MLQEVRGGHGQGGGPRVEAKEKDAEPRERDEPRQRVEEERAGGGRGSVSALKGSRKDLCWCGSLLYQGSTKVSLSLHSALGPGEALWPSRVTPLKLKSGFLHPTLF